MAWLCFRYMLVLWACLDKSRNTLSENKFTAVSGCSSLFWSDGLDLTASSVHLQILNSHVPILPEHFDKNCSLLWKKRGALMCCSSLHYVLCHEQCWSQLVHPAGWYAAGQREKGDGTPEAEVIIRLPEVIIFLAGMCLGVERGNLWTESNNEWSNKWVATCMKYPRCFMPSFISRTVFCNWKPNLGRKENSVKKCIRFDLRMQEVEVQVEKGVVVWGF